MRHVGGDRDRWRSVGGKSTSEGLDHANKIMSLVTLRGKRTTSVDPIGGGTGGGNGYGGQLTPFCPSGLGRKGEATRHHRCGEGSSTSTGGSWRDEIGYTIGKQPT